MTVDEMRRAAEYLENHADFLLLDEPDKSADADYLAAKLRAMADAAEHPLPPPPEAK